MSEPVPLAARRLDLDRLLTMLRSRAPVVGALGARALEAVAKFGLYALAARRLGAHDAGRFFLALSLIHIVSTLARMGLERPLTRHVAAELAVGDPAAARRAIRHACAAILIASLIAALTLLVCAPLAARLWAGGADLAVVVLFSALIIPVQNLAYAAAYILVGLERGGPAQLVMNALAPTLALGALIASVSDLTGLLTAYAAAFGACAALGVALVARDRRLDPAASPAPRLAAPLPSLWTEARRLMVVEAAQAALLSIPVLMLGALADPAAVSVFSLCSRLSMLVTTVVLSLGALSAPAFARHHRLQDWPALRDAVVRNRRATLAFCLPLITGLALAGASLLPVLGVASPHGLPVLMILMAGQLVFCLFPSRDLLLAMAGEGKVLRRLSLVQLVLCLALTAALIPPFGAIGAAVASALIWMGGATALAATARRRLPQLA